MNVSSAAGLIALPWHAAYSASKFGLRGISEVLRYDLRRHGIGVSVVCPGAVRTPLVGTAVILGIDRNHPEAKKFLKKFEGRAVTPEKVAHDIIRGIRKNRFLVMTSFDIKLVYWLKRKLFLVYHMVMMVLNKMMTRMVKKISGAPGESRGKRTAMNGEGKIEIGKMDRLKDTAGSLVDRAVPLGPEDCGPLQAGEKDNPRGIRAAG